MKYSRRNFLNATAAVGVSSLLSSTANAPAEITDALDEKLLRAASKPVLDVTPLKSPVVIESIELLRKGKEHFVRVRSKDVRAPETCHTFGHGAIGDDRSERAEHHSR